MCVAALSEVHQQLGGLFSDSQVPVFSDSSELRDHHHLNQLILKQVTEEKKLFKLFLLNLLSTARITREADCNAPLEE